jgi:hypothetical protein
MEDYPKVEVDWNHLSDSYIVNICVAPLADVIWLSFTGFSFGIVKVTEAHE